MKQIFLLVTNFLNIPKCFRKRSRLQDLPSIIKKTATFLNKRITDDEVQTLATHLSFANMKENPSVNYKETIENYKKIKLIITDGTFIRSGEVNQWKGKLSPDMIEKFDELTKKILHPVGLHFF